MLDEASSTRIEGRAGPGPGTDLQAATRAPEGTERTRKCRLNTRSTAGVDGTANIEDGVNRGGTDAILPGFGG